MQDRDKFIVKSVKLAKVLGVSSGPFVTELPEYAFAGRSNAGKSSLINMILKSKKAARVSASPGKTQTINYFLVNEEFYLVDLPGYGFANVSKAKKDEIARLCESYLAHTETLKKMFLLLDIRHKPSELDKTMYEWIAESGIEPVIIATKADKLGKNERLKAIRLIRETLALHDSASLILASSLKGEGRDEICANFT